MKKQIAAAMMAVLGFTAAAQAEITANHAFISFETIADAQKNVKADEYVVLTGKIVSVGEPAQYVLEDTTGRIQIAIPDELHKAMTLDPKDVFEVTGRAYRVPFEPLRIDAEKLRRLP